MTDTEKNDLPDVIYTYADKNKSGNDRHGTWYEQIGNYLNGIVKYIKATHPADDETTTTQVQTTTNCSYQADDERQIALTGTIKQKINDAKKVPISKGASVMIGFSENELECVDRMLNTIDFDDKALQAIHNLCSMANGFWRNQKISDGDKIQAYNDVELQSVKIRQALSTPPEHKIEKMLYPCQERLAHKEAMEILAKKSKEHLRVINDLKKTIERVPVMLRASINSNYAHRQFVCYEDAKRIIDMCDEEIKALSECDNQPPIA